MKYLALILLLSFQSPSPEDVPEDTILQIANKM